MSCIYLLKRSQKVRTWRGRSSITPSVIAGETAATSSKLDHPCPKSVSSLQNNDSHILNIIKSYNRMPGSQNTLEAIADVAAASYWPLPPSPTFDGQSPSRHYSCDSIHSDLSFLKASQAFLSMYGQPLSMLDTSSLVNTRFSDLAQRLSKMSTKSPPVKSGKYQGADNPLAPLPFSVLGEGTQETQINSHRTLYHDWQDKTALPSYDHAEDSPLSINKNTGRLHRWPSQRGSSSPIGLPPSTPPPAPPFLL
ncbi:uncharacterized protein BYT42DRAFT_75668 [Radiomyces spectabilis]|uniref:uncharacterized protein n=1 Tax=Radiomyces spectabilis TaxID=64574 RepID=UPI00221E6AE8|nr:uncharacterized protein BYT42DRAFT_75668 [Radiomyces spectabilis]KAI8371631.1 hypothetical protein BYT42DRAFT_75668 [Radiomyces spectabilis]